MPNRFNQTLALPFQTSLAFAKTFWNTTGYLYADISKERNLVVIPYHNPPLVNLRAKVRLWPLWLKWTIGLPGSLGTLLLFFVCAGYMTFVCTQNRPPNMEDLLIVLLLNISCMSLGLFTYSLFAIQDYLVSDRFSLFVPPVIFRLENLSRLPKYFGTKFWLYANRVHWSDLQELIIADTDKKKQHQFCLRLTGKSGISINIPLKNLPKASIEILIGQIEKNAPFCRNLSQLAELSRFQDYENGLLPLITYTQLWESLTAKRIDATSFAPLQPNTKLQNGRLTAVRQIASGGFSAVYLTEETDGSKFVLKEFVLPFGAEPELVKKRPSTLLVKPDFYVHCNMNK